MQRLQQHKVIVYYLFNLLSPFSQCSPQRYILNCAVKGPLTCQEQKINDRQCGPFTKQVILSEATNSDSEFSTVRKFYGLLIQLAQLIFKCVIKQHMKWLKEDERVKYSIKSSFEIKCL